MKFLKSGFILSLMAVSMNALAADGWKSSVEAGLILTSGNTETQSINLKGGVEHEMQNWRNEAKIEALNVKGTNGRLSEKYLAGGQSSYKFSNKAFAFATVAGEHDPFSGYAYQVSGSVGVGYRILENKTTKLDVGGGPGYRETRLRNESDSEGDAVLRLNGKYIHKISKTAEFSQELTAEIGDATIILSVSALTAQIAGNFSMKASFRLRNNSDVPEGFEDTDTETGLTLVYTF